MKKFLLLQCFLLIFSFLSAQKEVNVWYFGGGQLFANQMKCGGIDFNLSPPPALEDGKLATREGVSSMCDKQGKLLFYTDGITVFDATHDTMPNGTELKGSQTSTQSAIIVPIPNSTRYYIFTTGGIEDFIKNGLQYSIVDMALNGGMGSVAVKNVMIMEGVFEKVTAIHHTNNRDIWMVTHKFFSDSFYVFKVTAAGLDTIPVISKTGTVHGTIGGVEDAIGYMKASANGKRLGVITMKSDIIEVFDFDRNAGVISNNLQITSPDVFLNFHDAYGIEFSPSGQLLYVSTFQGNQLFQIDLGAGSLTDIINSTIEIAQGGMVFFGALQLGPDKRIYHAHEGTSFLGVIENPDVKGLGCNFKMNGFFLGDSSMSGLGLPNFISTYLSGNSKLQPYNIITPNGDNLNDSFRVDYENIIEYDIKIYNRWGEKMYESKDVSQAWDGSFNGEKLPPGTYYYLLNAKGADFKEYSVNGTITVLYP